MKVVFALAYEGQIEATSNAGNERAYLFTGPLRLLNFSTLESIFEIRWSRWKKYKKTLRSAMCMGCDGGRQDISASKVPRKVLVRSFQTLKLPMYSDQNYIVLAFII